MKKLVLVITLAAIVSVVTGCGQQQARRYGMVIGVREEKLAEYKKLHAAVWPGVLKTIKECNIRNYSIYLGELERNGYHLFSYLEYTGKSLNEEYR